MELSAFAFKVNCAGTPSSIKFKTRLGFGLEEELTRLLTGTTNMWRPCAERDTTAWINLKIGFSIARLYKSEDANFMISAHGNFPGVSDETLIEDLNKALKKGNKEKSKEALIKLIMRFPYNQEYKKQFAELKEL